jgi:hypothetical protein
MIPLSLTFEFIIRDLSLHGMMDFPTSLLGVANYASPKPSFRPAWMTYESYRIPQVKNVEILEVDNKSSVQSEPGNLMSPVATK